MRVRALCVFRAFLVCRRKAEKSWLRSFLSYLRCLIWWFRAARIAHKRWWCSHCGSPSTSIFASPHIDYSIFHTGTVMVAILASNFIRFNWFCCCRWACSIGDKWMSLHNLSGKHTILPNSVSQAFEFHFWVACSSVTYYRKIGVGHSGFCSIFIYRMAPLPRHIKRFCEQAASGNIIQRNHKNTLYIVRCLLKSFLL